VVYFSLDPRNPVACPASRCRHACFLAADGWLIESRGHYHRRLVRASDIPATFGGAAGFQVANALAAAAAARALGLTTEQVARALAAFDGGAHNPGRMNLFRVGCGYVLLDYGHNPAALEAVAGLTRHWPGRRVTAVFTAPGDRGDELIRECGRAAARCFDRLIVREDGDRRGREDGSIARLLCEAAREVDGSVECGTTLDECEATRAAIDSMTDGEVVVLFYEDYDAVLGILQECGAEPAPGPSAEPAGVRVG
jgi:cyanophycin synthetase